MDSNEEKKNECPLCGDFMASMGANEKTTDDLIKIKRNKRQLTAKQLEQINDALVQKLIIVEKKMDAVTFFLLFFCMCGSKKKPVCTFFCWFVASGKID